MDKNAEATALEADWLTLVAPRIITTTRSIYPGFGVKPLYTDQLETTAGEWTGESTIMVSREQDEETQFIISSLELYRLDGGKNMPELFTKIFKEELGL